MKIPFFNLDPIHSKIKPLIIKEFEKVYDSNWFVLGKNVKKFEKKYAQFSKVNYAIGISNGLDALTLCLKSLGIGPGDEVIVPSNTYVASVLSISHLGATPVFVEPNIQTYNIDIKKIIYNVTSKTKVILPVHLYGLACEMEIIKEIAETHNLYIVEDNAQGHGAKYNDQITGSWGDANATSFYPTKNLGCLGDSGAVTTNSLEVFNKVSSLRNYGSIVKYENEMVGHNMRMDEIQAAVLSIKLEYLKSWTVKRREIAKKYSELLQGIGDLILPMINKDSTHVFHLYVIRTESRDKLNDYLNSNGIGTSIHYPIPPHLQKAYSYMNYKTGSFPIAEELSNTSLSIPIWPGLMDSEIEFITSKIKFFFHNQ
jgi:dTDP-4-amino-4,6-dideoxygalactose transaminase